MNSGAVAVNKIKSLTSLPNTLSYLRRIGAEPRSLRTAVVKENIGKYWKDVAIISFTRDGNIDYPEEHYKPTDDEAAKIKLEFAGVRWPEVKRIYTIVDPPEMIKKADPKDIYEFRDELDMIQMIQVRITTKEGKAYIPWTFWDDDEWRSLEPEGMLPLYNLNKLKDSQTVFIHEGAKAARAISEMSEGRTLEGKEKAKNHPWFSELTGAVHLGWIGGALSPSRTNWEPLVRLGVKRVYIVADNDTPGRSAVPAISQRIRIPTFLIQFTDEFPISFDLADDFPERMFSTIEGIRYYTGPAFRDCLHPATWATDLIPNPRGRPTPILRESFRGMWAYIEEADVFVCTEMPEIIRSEAILNKMLAPFSHAAETTKLIVKAYRGRSARICYRPDESGLTVTFRGSSAINLHVPSVIRSKPGDIEPWTDFLKYMFVKESERRQIERWCATLIARPEIRIGYGLLLVSERQGIGKEQPLTSRILTPSGWKTMADMRIGEIISSSSEGNQAVTGVYPQGEKDVYEVKFSDDSIVECGINHNWYVRKNKDWTVMTTAQIINVINMWKGHKNNRVPIWVPMNNPFYYINSERLPLPAYVVGALIGDGYLNTGSAWISIPDYKMPILEKMKGLVAPNYHFTITPKETTSCPQYRLTTVENYRVDPDNSRPNIIRKLGIDKYSSERFIPNQYLISSIEDRIELLRGLIDTDGRITDGRVSFSTSSKRLSEDVVELVKSLGGVATVKVYSSARDGVVEKTEYRVRIRTNFNPASDSFLYKSSQWRMPAKEYGNRIVSVTKKGKAEQQCISVSSKDNLYVTDGFKQTHNTTLGSTILAPLVGYSNVGFPSEADIMSQFNDWIAHKRLVVIGEIYSGASWKAYHLLKQSITDKDVTVNQKYMRPYQIENWCHVVACSNSMRALKMENDDRRWFYPEITEHAWPKEKFIELRSWLERGGLSIIRHWAENYGSYIHTSERAPMTDRKAELIEGSRSEAQRECASFAESIRDDERPICILLKEVVAWARTVVQGRIFDSDYELKRAMTEMGLKTWPERIKVAGGMHYVLYNSKLDNQISVMIEKSDKLTRIRECVMKVGELYNEGL